MSRICGKHVLLNHISANGRVAELSHALLHIQKHQVAAKVLELHGTNSINGRIDRKGMFQSRIM
jgi:hypothetical protein